MNFFLFSCLASSRGKMSEFPELTTEYISDEEFEPNAAPPPLSKYAFVTAITGDDDLEHEVLKCAMLAFSMWTTNPNIDRVLIISTNFKMGGDNEARLAKLFTHVYFSPYIQFPCSTNLSKKSDKNFWFKLNALTVTNYEKIMWVGKNGFIVKDMAPLFEYPAPAAPPDYQLWGMSEFGPIHNFDLFLVEPSLDDFKNLREKACSWIAHPEVSEERKKMEGAAFIGAYDNGLFEEYYNTRMTTFPKYACYEVPGIKDGIDLKRDEESDPKILSYLFSNGNMPWDNPSYVVSEAWLFFLKKMFVMTEEDPNLPDKSISPPASNQSAHLLTSVFPSVKKYSDDEILRSFIEFQMITHRRFINNCVCIVIASVLVLMYVLFNTNDSISKTQETKSVM